MTQIEVFSKVIGSNPNDPPLSPVVLSLFEDRIAVGELIRRTVEEQITDLILTSRMNAEQARRALNRQYLTQTEIDEQVRRGGAVRYPADKEANPDQLKFDMEAEVTRALEGFEQGAYIVMVDGDRMDRLDEEIVLGLDSKITFLRLTPLVGG